MIRPFDTLYFNVICIQSQGVISSLEDILSDISDNKNEDFIASWNYTKLYAIEVEENTYSNHNVNDYIIVNLPWEIH